MYHSNQEIATRLYEALDDLILTDDKGTVSIDKLINPQQKYDMIMHIIRCLPPTIFQQVLAYNEEIETPVEKTHIIQEFLYGRRGFEQILAHAIELGFAVGHNNLSIYNAFIYVFNRIEKKDKTINLETLLHILVNTLHTTYTVVQRCNFTDILDDAVEEVLDSNRTKSIPFKDEKALKKSVEELQNKGHNIVTHNLQKGHNIIYDTETGNILESIYYIKPDLKTIINKHLKQKR